MDAPARPHILLPRRVAAVAVLLLIVGASVASNPPATAARTYTPVAGLPGATRVDRLIIKRIHIDIPIKKGVIGNAIHERTAYQYPGTSWPGGGTNTYLYAHARTGAFINLKVLRPGDIIKLRVRGTKTWLRYVVTKEKRVKWNDGKWTLLTSSERLTLQTCTGNTATADRIVVVAVALH